MARKRKIVVLFFLICSIVKPQTIINRFKVPVKFKSNFAIGYDDNYLRLSNTDLREGDLNLLKNHLIKKDYLILLEEQLRTTISKSKIKNMKQNYFLPMNLLEIVKIF